jgi:hypothetical protein
VITRRTCAVLDMLGSLRPDALPLAHTGPYV